MDEELDREAANTASEEPAQGALAEELAKKDAEIADLKNQILYLRADFENTKKRIEKRYRESLEFAAEPLLKDLLSVLDNLEKGVEHAKEAGPDALSALVEGLELVVSQFRNVLMRHGVEDIAADGEKFDPHVHESMVHLPGEEENKVAAVFEKGYLLKGRLLRPAKVAVSKVAGRETDG